MIAARYESNKNTYFVYLSDTGTVIAEYEMTLYYENSGSQEAASEFQVSADALYLYGTRIIVAGTDINNNYSIVKFVLGTSPMTATYEIVHNRGSSY